MYDDAIKFSRVCYTTKFVLEFFIFYSNIRNLLFCYCNNFKLLFYFSCFYLTLSVLWINGLSPFIKLLFSLNQYMYIESYKPYGPSPFSSKEKLTYGIMNIIFQIHYVAVFGLVFDFATLKSIFLASSGVLTYPVICLSSMETLIGQLLVRLPTCA